MVEKRRLFRWATAVLALLVLFNLPGGCTARIKGIFKDAVSPLNRFFVHTGQSLKVGADAVRGFGGMLEENNRLSEENFSFGQVSFYKDCPQKQDEKQITIIEVSKDCSNVNQELDLSRITRLSDNNDQFVIINDILCKNVSLGTYVSQKAYSDISIEDLSGEKFCMDWISKYP